MLANYPRAVLASTAPRHVFGGRAGLTDIRLLKPLPLHLFANPVGNPSSLAIRRDAVVKVGGFDERLLAGEASELKLRLAFLGDFAVLQRRTVIREYNPGLKEWARRRGEFLRALELGLNGVIERLRTGGDQRARELFPRAAGSLCFVDALRALDRNDPRDVETALREACRLCPELNSHPEEVEQRLTYLPLAHVPGERLRHLITAALLWPDPRCDTALYLRACALFAALWVGAGRHAVRLIAGWPLGASVRSLRRASPGLVRRARRERDVRSGRGSDEIDFDAVLEARA
jgi:hypothetical protein